MGQPNSPRLVTVKQAAEMLGCSEANVYALLDNGELPYVPIGRRKGYRIDVEDISRFIEQRKVWQQPPPKPRRSRQRLKHLKLPMSGNSRPLPKSQ